MDFYNVIIAPKAIAQLDSYIDYLINILMNEQAAQSVWQDAVDTRAALETIAGSLKFCSHPRLKRLRYRIIPFRRHRYVMLYRIEDMTVYVEGIYHELQDYENLFASELGNR